MQLLSATQTAQEGPRKQAEQQLLSLYGHQELPLGLVGIACHASVPLNIRQASLLYLKNLVLAGWSDSLDEFKGQILVTDDNKLQLRQRLLELATADQLDRKLKAAAGLVVSKIAIADYPIDWPDLLDSLLQLIPNASDGQLHGALKVLGELVEDCLNENTFFGVAPRLIKALYDVAINDQRKPTLRALACKVFHGCFDILEMVLEDHKATVKGFADEILKDWIPFFINVMNTRLPDPPSYQDEEQDSPGAELYKGNVAFKLQVVKVSHRQKLCKQHADLHAGAHAHTIRLPSHPRTPEPDSVPSHLDRALPPTTSLLSHVHTRRAPEPTRRRRWTTVHLGFSCPRRARLHAGMSPSTPSPGTA